MQSPHISDVFSGIASFLLFSIMCIFNVYIAIHPFFVADIFRLLTLCITEVSKKNKYLYKNRAQRERLFWTTPAENLIFIVRWKAGCWSWFILKNIIIASNVDEKIKFLSEEFLITLLLLLDVQVIRSDHGYRVFC